MKTKTYLRQPVILKLLLVTPIIAILLIAISSCGKNNSTEVTLKEDTSLPSADQVHFEVDELPVFPGGDQAILNFIAQNTSYPEEAKKNNITGKVLLKFIVEKDCSVSNIEVLQGADPLLDAEALRVIGTLPKFETPAKKDGKAVRVHYMLPITFALK